MTPRLLPLALIAFASLTAPCDAAAGWWSDDEWHVRPTAGRTPHLSGAVRGYKLTSTTGRHRTVHLPQPAALDGTFTLPAGEWAELTLLLDGPVTVALGAAEVDLDLDALTVPLADPGAASVRLEWTLPEPLADQLQRGGPSADLAEALARALEDGGLAAP